MAGTGEPLWYFAYGSNLSLAVFTGRRGMRPLATRTGHLDGYRLCFNLPVGPGERGVANLERAPDERTCGVLYLLTAEDFERLDRTELVHRGVYARTAVEVVAAEGERVAALTYCSSLSVEGRKPSARYMRLLLEGARAHRLPPEWVQYLEGLELAVDERSPPPD